jgi:hypothetical protein
MIATSMAGVEPFELFAIRYGRHRYRLQPDVIPGHDPRVMELYRPPSAELDGIAIRLEVAPRMSRA